MTRRRLTAVLLTLLFLLLPTAGDAGAAGYRYWSFWTHDGKKWTYATEGPSTARPYDGDVQGFRFAVSADSADADQPRGAASFATICAKTPPRVGEKRVALVIDFGIPTDAPAGETPPAPRTACAQVPSDATTAEALASVAKPLRYDSNALLCAIAGYPEKGCGEQVTAGKKPTEAKGTEAKGTEAKEKDPGPSLGLYAGAAAVAALAVGALWQARRRKHG
jgi:hypothetical protein